MRAREWAILSIKEKYDAYDSPILPTRLQSDGSITAGNPVKVRR